ncbi:MAG: preprotein translocase subunit SecG [Bacteroidales bacterium]|jgi:preprotein translocase subunit SecG|nr:preprotein translocase subunit SecG [Bacteroidales bacterium]NLK82090.1 preprotein translocase subunit SecG [Bacteroidales bacterium]HPY81852.1 preprotein translocase subunit SecG [Bacteroidales bacterium]
MGQVIFNILIIITSILIILIVLVQNSKGGGLASNFGSSGQLMGVKKETDFLEKATWSLAIALVFFCFLSTMTLDKVRIVEKRSQFEENIPTSPLVVPEGIQTAEDFIEE